MAEHPRRLTTIAFDADDTLWHNERVFRGTQDRFHQLLSNFASDEDIRSKTLEVERRNLRLYGYGVKGFTLSLVETAIEVTQGRIDSRGIAQILAWGRDMLSHPVEPLSGVRQVLNELGQHYDLMLITKGDLFDQQRKIAQSGLADQFMALEIVSEKDVETYRNVFTRHGVIAERTVMIGNSMKSDILPLLELNAHAIHIPYEITWEMELADAPIGNPRFHKASAIVDVIEIITRLET